MITLATHPAANELNAIEKLSKKLDAFISEAGNVHRKKDTPRSQFNKARALYEKIGKRYDTLLGW